MFFKEHYFLKDTISRNQDKWKLYFYIKNSKHFNKYFNAKSIRIMETFWKTNNVQKESLIL